MTDDSCQNDELITGVDHIPRKTTAQRFLALFIILVLLGAGIGAAVLIIKTKPQAKRSSPAGKMQTLVEVIKATPDSFPVLIRGYGTVVPARSVTIQARVSGTVQEMHPQFIPGGIVKKGQTLVRLDDIDYRLALRQKENFLTQQKADMRLEEGNRQVARKEWELVSQFTDTMDDAARDIVLREPQLAKAEANIKSAATELEKTRVDLDRTVIKAPFDAIVADRNIDIGSQVSPQSNLGTLVGSESFWAEIAVSTDKLQWFTLPDGAGSGAEVSLSSGNTAYRGRIIKLLPELEKNGLLARLLVEIKDPYGLHSDKNPLLLNSFVKAEIEGKTIADIYKIPRLAVKDKTMIFTVSEKNTLHIQPVKVLWYDTESAYISEGLEPGAGIIVTSIAAPIEDMELKVSDSGSDTPDNKKQGPK